MCFLFARNCRHFTGSGNQEIVVFDREFGPALSSIAARMEKKGKRGSKVPLVEVSADASSVVVLIR